MLERVVAVLAGPGMPTERAPIVSMSGVSVAENVVFVARKNLSSPATHRGGGGALVLPSDAEADTGSLLTGMVLVDCEKAEAAQNRVMRAEMAFIRVMEW